MTDDSKKSGSSDDVQIITPPNVIRRKVSGSGGPSPDMLAKAEAAINKMTDDYPSWAIVDVDRLGALISEAVPGKGNGKERMQDAYKLAHDMRGQGGSFGYPMITQIAGSFCRFTEALEEVDHGALEICQAHVKAMRAILQNRVKGDGGRVGGQIVAGLEKAVGRYMDKRK